MSKIITVSGIDNVLRYANKKVENCKSASNGKAWIGQYQSDYNAVVKIEQQIQSMSFSAVVSGYGSYTETRYKIKIDTLDEYFNLYDLLKSLKQTAPYLSSTVNLSGPDIFRLTIDIGDFCQVD